MAQEPNAGELRHTVTIQQLQQRPDTDTGEPIRTWADLYDVYARVEPLTSREQIRAKESHMDISHRVTIRYTPDLDSSQYRLNYQGRTLNISGIVDLEERHRWLELSCTEEK